MGNTKSTDSPRKGQVLYSASSLKRWTGKAVPPGGARQTFPWHQPAHGEVGQKIQRISAQARPDIPFQCQRCQCWAGRCAASSQSGSGGLALLHMGSWATNRGKSHRPRGQHAQHSVTPWFIKVNPLKYKHLTLTHTAPWVPARFLAPLVELQAVSSSQGNRAVVNTSSSSASRQSSPLKLQPHWTQLNSFSLWTGLDHRAMLESETKTSPEAEDLMIFLS